MSRVIALAESTLDFVDTVATRGMFPQWKGSALVGGLASKALIRIVIEGANATGAEPTVQNDL
jgi:glucose/arabinose dehydrogenase